jgi:hypothetical protein
LQKDGKGNEAAGYDRDTAIARWQYFAVLMRPEEKLPNLEEEETFMERRSHRSAQGR